MEFIEVWDHLRIHKVPFPALPAVHLKVRCQIRVVKYRPEDATTTMEVTWGLKYAALKIETLSLDEMSIGYAKARTV